MAHHDEGTNRAIREMRQSIASELRGMTPMPEPSIPARGLCTCRGTVPTVRAYHEPECPVATAYDKQLWAKDVLADPARASVEMSGMSREDLDEIREAFDA